MKRFLSILICAIFVCSFAGCGESKEEQERALQEFHAMQEKAEEAQPIVTLPEEAQAFAEIAITTIDNFVDGLYSADTATSSLAEIEDVFNTYYEQYLGEDLAKEMFLIANNIKEARVAITGYYLEDYTYTIDDIVEYRNRIAGYCGIEERE